MAPAPQAASHPWRRFLQPFGPHAHSRRTSEASWSAKRGLQKRGSSCGKGGVQEQLGQRLRDLFGSFWVNIGDIDVIRYRIIHRIHEVCELDVVLFFAERTIQQSPSWQMFKNNLKYWSCYFVDRSFVPLTCYNE